MGLLLYGEENTDGISMQTYFGLHNDDGKEEDFWKEETIFTFVSFLQFKEKEGQSGEKCFEYFKKNCNKR